MENYKEKLHEIYELLNKKTNTYYFEGGFSEDFPDLDTAIDNDEELSLSMFTTLSMIISQNIIGKNEKIIRNNPLNNKVLTNQLFNNQKKLNKTIKVLDAAYETGFFNDIPHELLPEYLEGLYKNK